MAFWRNEVKPGMLAVKEQGGGVLQASSLSEFPAGCILACSAIHNIDYDISEGKASQFFIAPSGWFDRVFLKG